MKAKNRTAKKTVDNRKADPITLAPLDFETAVRAAMATGRPPKAKRAGSAEFGHYEIDRATEGGGWSVFQIDQTGKRKEHSGFDSESDAEWWAQSKQRGQLPDWTDRPSHPKPKRTAKKRKAKK